MPSIRAAWMVRPTVVAGPGLTVVPPPDVPVPDPPVPDAPVPDVPVEAAAEVAAGGVIPQLHVAAGEAAA